MLLSAIKSVSACTVLTGSNIIEENESKVYTLLTISLIFFAAAVTLNWFKKGREGLIFIFVSGVVLFLSWAFSNTRGGDCGIGALQIAQICIAVTFFCFVAQFATWLMFRKKSQVRLS